jgi:hypothetical protein
MAGVNIFLYLEAILAPSSARLVANKADSLYHDLAAAGSTLLSIEELGQS